MTTNHTILDNPVLHPTRWRYVLYLRLAGALAVLIVPPVFSGGRRGKLCRDLILLIGDSCSGRACDSLAVGCRYLAIGGPGLAANPRQPVPKGQTRSTDRANHELPLKDMPG
jgi:hypothetical protein